MLFMFSGSTLVLKFMGGGSRNAKRMNPFIVIAACFNVLGVGWHLYYGEWKMAIVWVLYAAATFTLSFAK